MHDLLEKSPLALRTCPSTKRSRSVRAGDRAEHRTREIEVIGTKIADREREMERVDDFRSEEKSVSRRGLSDLIGRGGGTREHSGGLHLAVVVARSSRFVARKARDNWNERISINPTPGRGYIQVRSGAQRVVVHTATLADQPAKHCQAGNKRGGQKNLQHRYRTAMNPQW